MGLSQAIENYIEQKRPLGMVFRVQSTTRRVFANPQRDIQMTKVSTDSVRRFLDGTGPVTQYWFYKYRTVHCFYRFAISRRYVDHSPLPVNKPQPPEDFQPYVHISKDRFRLLDASVCQRLFTHSRRFASVTSTPKSTSPTPANKMRNKFTASCALG